ncbi:MAG: MFS transporter [Clostridia bacterium]|nr:MFS transporter [Clostridia bacterium]
MKPAALIKDGVSKVRTYWKTPPLGRYMTFKEIGAYSGGGIGAYMIINIGTACLLSTNNTLLSSTLGIDPTDMYIMYVIAVIVNVLLTGVRANIIDNTRNKAGKYRPYIVSMAIPSAILCNIVVWFPYAKLDTWLGDGMLFGETRGYIAKCAIIMVLNLLLHFFYYFFYDAYENLIHVLSPNTQERTDVASVKSIIYSFAPTVVNLFTPIIASGIFKTNMTDIRVYRLLYPIFTVLGLLLCMVVYKHTEEKIVQARTHVVQIKFTDALKAVAKNKYFWIISLASWIGFLESAYSNVLFWIYNYGGACSGGVYGIVVKVYGNASLWGMILAPFAVKRWGKKAVLIVTNLFNIVFILSMLPFVKEISGLTIWLVMGCLWLNALMGSFMHILNPAIQADIRDYQQYITGERIDGMFSAVATIGTVITLATSSVLPAIYEKFGVTKENAAVVTSNPAILDRVLGDGKTVGTILAEQFANGQDNYNNAFSALYDPYILSSLLRILIVIAAVGAAMNVVPYIWYDFNEIKQKSVIRVLKIRSMFEDYGNGVLNDGNLVEAIDIINNAREMAGKEKVAADKKSWKSIKDKAERKAAKNAYFEAVLFNEEIEVSKFVCDELDKFSKPEFVYRLANSKSIFSLGLGGILSMNAKEVKNELAEAKAMPKSNTEEKAIRKAAIEIAKSKLSAIKAVKKYYADGKGFEEPDYTLLEASYDLEDKLEAELKGLNNALKSLKKDANAYADAKARIAQIQVDLKEARAESKRLSDSFANFTVAAKPYIDAKKLLTQSANYEKLDEIAAIYEAAKLRYEESLAKAKADAERTAAEEKAYSEKLKAEKAAAKAAKKNKK